MNISSTQVIFYYYSTDMKGWQVQVADFVLLGFFAQFSHMKWLQAQLLRYVRSWDADDKIVHTYHQLSMSVWTKP